MTVVINYVSDYLSVIMTDRRVSYGRNAELGYSDDNIKLIDLKEMGWAAGAGLADYLTELKVKLSESVVTNIEGIMDIYDEVTTSNIKNDPYFEKDIKHSVVSFSFQNFDFEKGMFKFNIGLLNKEYVNEEGIKAVPPNRINIIYPSDLAEDHIYGPLISEKHEVYYEMTDFDQLIYRLLTVFSDVVKHSKFVSDECDIGIELFQPNGIYKLKISGNVYDLIQSCNEKTIQNNIEIINTITASD